VDKNLGARRDGVGEIDHLFTGVELLAIVARIVHNLSSAITCDHLRFRKAFAGGHVSHRLACRATGINDAE
jgi:hypothetical protein